MIDDRKSKLSLKKTSFFIQWKSFTKNRKTWFSILKNIHKIISTYNRPLTKRTYTLSPRVEQPSYSPMVYNVCGRRRSFKKYHTNQSISLKRLTLSCFSSRRLLGSIECENDENISYHRLFKNFKVKKFIFLLEIRHKNKVN